MKDLVSKLIEQNKTISTMESCTGGGLANAITNIEGASNILKYSAITYSNEFKIKMGVNEKTIEKYSVYSIEVAKEMSKCISKFTNSNFGVGITGKLNSVDINNPYGEDNVVFISIYNSEDHKFYIDKLAVKESTRKENKDLVINRVKELLLNIL